MSSSDIQVDFRSTPQVTAIISNSLKPPASIEKRGIEEIGLSSGVHIRRPSGYLG